VHEIPMQRLDEVGTLEDDLRHVGAGLEISASLELEQVALRADDRPRREPFEQPGRLARGLRFRRCLARHVRTIYHKATDPRQQASGELRVRREIARPEVNRQAGARIVRRRTRAPVSSSRSNRRNARRRFAEGCAILGSMSDRPRLSELRIPAVGELDPREAARRPAGAAANDAQTIRPAGALLYSTPNIRYATGRGRHVGVDRGHLSRATASFPPEGAPILFEYSGSIHVSQKLVRDVRPAYTWRFGGVAARAKAPRVGGLHPHSAARARTRARAPRGGQARRAPRCWRSRTRTSPSPTWGRHPSTRAR